MDPLILNLHWMELIDQLRTLAALPSGKNPGMTAFTELLKFLLT